MQVHLTPKKFLLGTLALIFAGVLLALLVAYSGIYNIAASRGHPAWLNWFLTLGMQRSVQVNSGDVKIPEFYGESLAPLGAAHFHSGCAVCHGAPGVPINPVFDHMLPTPPTLREHVKNWNETELFWIVRHGLQYAGMPGWSGSGRENEVWAVVSFLKLLPDLSVQEYDRISQGNAEYDPLQDDGTIQPIDELLSNCSRCHGTENKAVTSAWTPRLGGQHKQYLKRALTEYKHDRRESGFMEPAANLLEQNDIELLAEYYSNLNEAVLPPISFSQEVIALGKKIVEQGDRAARIPACAQCHQTNVTQTNSQFPKLDGQNYTYLYEQMMLWHHGGRVTTAYGELMGVVAKRMTPEQIHAVCAYYASQSPFTALSTQNNVKGGRD